MWHARYCCVTAFLRREAALADLDAMRGREQAARDALDERIKVAFAQYYVASRALAVNRG
jgi:outer membrane protein, heavy metal efflux system